MARVRRHTRQQILSLLKSRGPMSAAALAGHLDISEVAVRQHLKKLNGDRLADFRESRTGVGRPARIWSLTSRGNGEFPDSHGQLSATLLRCTRSVFGASGLKDLIAAERRETTSRYLSCMDDGCSTEERLAILAEQRTADGFMAEWSNDGEGRYRYTENHCSISTAARACDMLCDSELTMFREILGPHVDIVRTSHLLSGAGRCSYAITALEET